jgi:hypothetical protein
VRFALQAFELNSVRLRSPLRKKSHKASEVEVGTVATSAGTWFPHIYATAWIALGSMVLGFVVPPVRFLTGKLGGFSGTLQMCVCSPAWCC